MIRRLILVLALASAVPALAGDLPTGASGERPAAPDMATTTTSPGAADQARLERPAPTPRRQPSRPGRRQPAFNLRR